MQKNYKYKVFVRCYTYNQSSYILDTINGFCIQQISFPVVYCIVDDASTDGERIVLREWAEQNLYLNNDEGFYKREMPYGELFYAPLQTDNNALFVILLLNENHHLKKDKLVYLTEWWQNAEYNAYCEGDDYWISADKIQKQIDFLDNNPEFGLIRTNVNRLYQSNSVYEERIFDKSRIKDTYKDYLYHAWWAAPCTWVFRTELYQKAVDLAHTIQKIGGFPGDIVDILYFSCHSKIKYLPDVTAVYRVLDNSMSHFGNKNVSDSFFKSIRKTQRYFAKYYSSFFTRLCLEFFYTYKDLRYQLGMIKKIINK